MKKSGWLLRLLLEWALICVGVLGSVCCLTTAYGFELPRAIPVLVPVLALFFCLLFVDKPGRYYALGVLALLLLAAWLLRKEMAEGLRNLWGTLGGIYVKGYDFFRDFLPREATDPGAIGPGLVTLAVAETYLCSLAVRLWRRTLPAALALLPGIAACFILIDTPPKLLPLLAAVFSILTQAFSQSVRRRKTGEQSKAIALSALLSAVLLGLLLFFIPEESYSPPITWKELTAKLERWGEEQNNRGNTNAGLGGNPDTVDLTNLGALPNRPITALYATSSLDGYLYLRGSSYTGFDGSKWTRGALWQGGPEALFPFLDLPGTGSLRIETRSTEAVLYTTYQLTGLPRTGAVRADAYLENTEAVDSYTMLFNQDLSGEEDPAYGAWVRENCLELPEQTRAAVLAWWEAVDGGKPPAAEARSATGGDQVMLPTVSPARVEAFARRVAAAVSQTAHYSRNPVQPPEGADFCTWFLNEAQEGYCVHYATACTALLRAMDIPARYVSGYVCRAEAGVRTAVSNLHAHAWVEIWVGGRWIPVEPTPEEATEFTGSVNPGSNDPENTTEPPLPPASEELTDPPPITKPGTTEPVESTVYSPLETGEPSGTGIGNESQPKDWTVLRILWGILGFVALTVGRRELTLWLRERRLTRAKGNDKARLLYRHVLRLHRLGGGAIPDEAREIAGKAAFSQHTVTDEELFCLRQVYEKQRSRLAIERFWKRLWYRYGLAVI